jgi:uncharacterized membrane protein
LFDDLKPEVKRSWDLSAIIILSLLLALFIYAIPDNPGRIVLGLPFILFFPGYALIGTLFPEKKSLDLIERVALSFGLSIAVVPLIGFGLNYTPFGIRLEPILWSLIAFNVAFSLLAMWRRSSSTEPFLPFESKILYSSVTKQFQGGSKVDRALTVILVLAILSSVIALVYVVAVPRDGEHFSEFYVLGPGGKATDYPSNLTVNQAGQVILGIANHEYQTVTYTIEVWLSNATYADNATTIHQLYFVGSTNVTLDHVAANTEGNWTKQWESPYNISVPFPGQYKMWFVLLKDGQPFEGQTNIDYAGTTTQARFLESINGADKNLSLNLNLNITA